MAKNRKSKAPVKYWLKGKFWLMVLVGMVAGVAAFHAIGFVIGAVAGVYVGKMAVIK